MDRNPRSPIQCPKKVVEQIMQIRDTGEVNMMDRRSVQFVADECGLFDLVCWIDENPKDYVRGINRGFNVVDG